jgi:hypothetical protein
MCLVSVNSRHGGSGKNNYGRIAAPLGPLQYSMGSVFLERFPKQVKLQTLHGIQYFLSELKSLDMIDK